MGEGGFSSVQCNGTLGIQTEQPYHEGHATVGTQSVLSYLHFDGLESYGKSKTATLQKETLPSGQSEVKSGDGEY